jgi:hypothetical protein
MEMSDALLDDLIRHALNDPLEPEQALGWPDVVERARRTASLPVAAPRWRRRMVVAAALAACVIAPVAVAFHGPLLTLIEGKAAPSSVKTTFTRWNVLKARGLDQVRQFERAHGATHPVIGPLALADAAKAEGVLELQIPQGSISLWQAPLARGGGECWLLAFQLDAHAAFGEGSCDEPATDPPPIRSFEWVASRALSDLVVFHARLSGAASADLVFPGGQTEPMQIVDGHAVAAFATKVFPLTLIAKNAAGDVLETQPLHQPPSFATCRAAVDECSGSTSFGGSGSSSFGSSSFGPTVKHEKGTR